MKTLGALLSFAVVVLLGMAFLAHAGGQGAVETDLEVAEIYYPNPGQARTNPIGPTVGKVIFSPTASGKMNVTVQVKDGEPETAFDCYVVPPGSWEPDGDRTTLTLNKQGKGTVHLQVKIPDPAVFIKVVMITDDESIAYCTERVLDFIEED